MAIKIYFEFSVWEPRCATQLTNPSVTTVTLLEDGSALMLAQQIQSNADRASQGKLEKAATKTVLGWSDVCVCYDHFLHQQLKNQHLSCVSTIVIDFKMPFPKLFFPHANLFFQIGEVKKKNTQAVCLTSELKNKCDLRLPLPLNIKHAFVRN